MVTNQRIKEVAEILSRAYEAEFGGKRRGRFQIYRQDLKKLLGVQRLHDSTVQRLIEACFEKGLVVIDLDDTFAVAELDLIRRWRKLPDRLVEEYVDSLDDDLDDDDDDDERDEDEPHITRRRIHSAIARARARSREEHDGLEEDEDQ